MFTTFASKCFDIFICLTIFSLQHDLDLYEIQINDGGISKFFSCWFDVLSLFLFLEICQWLLNDLNKCFMDMQSLKYQYTIQNI